MRKFVLFLFVVLFGTFTLFGQSVDSQTRKYWISASLGHFQTVKSVEGAIWGIDVNMLKYKTLLKVRFTECSEIGPFLNQPEEKYHNGSLMVGKGLYKKYFQLSLSVGIGLTKGVIRGDFISGSEVGLFGSDLYKKESFLSPSIPIELELSFIPLKQISLATSFFVDLNLKNPMYGFLMKCSLGKMR